MTMQDAVHLVCAHCNSINRLSRERLGEKAFCGSCKQRLFTAQPFELTSSNFQRHITQNAVPIVVDFWAPWCGPCRMMAPAFAQAAAQLEPTVRLAKVNTESEQGIAAQFGIRSIPTLVMFHDGREVARQSGALSLDDLVRWVRSHI